MNQLNSVCMETSAPSSSASSLFVGGIDHLIQTWSDLAPRESRLATGQIIQALGANPAGLSKCDLMKETDSSFPNRSDRYISALETAVQKRIQRARKKIRPFGMDILYCRDDARWRLVPAQWGTPVA